MSNSSPPPTATAGGGATTFSDLHADILTTHILTRLDGPTLAAASCASSQLRRVSAQRHLWSTACHLTWPSTAASPRLRHLISAFPGGPRNFFSLSYPVLHNHTTAGAAPAPAPAPELLSAVDIHYKNNLIFSKVLETETKSGWFKCSPFRVDLLDPKEVVPTTARHPDSDGACASLAEDMTLNWVIIDPAKGRAANLSSYRPVAVTRHWLSGEVQVRFTAVLPRGRKKGAAGEHVQCGMVVTCGGSETGEMHVREVSLQMEDMDGMHLNGEESLVILLRAMEGKRVGSKRREEEGRKRYKDYLDMKRERRERKLRHEGTLDKLCVAFGVAVFAAWVCFLFL